MIHYEHCIHIQFSLILFHTIQVLFFSLLRAWKHREKSNYRNKKTDSTLISLWWMLNARKIMRNVKRDLFSGVTRFKLVVLFWAVITVKHILQLNFRISVCVSFSLWKLLFKFKYNFPHEIMTNILQNFSHLIPQTRGNLKAFAFFLVQDPLNFE